MIDLRIQRPWEDEDAVLFRDSLRKLLADMVPGNDARWRKQKYVDREYWKQLGSLGALCPSIPDAYGGSGGTFAFDAIVAEELAYADTSSFTGVGVHGNIVAHYILGLGTEEQKQSWLPGMASGDLIGAIAMTEPGGGSDLRGMRTTARKVGGDYVINGSKIFITNGQIADVVILACKTDPDAGSKGISLIVAETRDLPGFERGRGLDKIGLHGSDTAELAFSDVRVPCGNLLGEEGRGLQMMMRNLPQERIGIAVGAQAQLERAIELTHQYTSDRTAFGQRLVDFQASRHKLAECLTEALVSRAFIDRCIARQIEGSLTSSEASMAKCWSTDRAYRVIDDCVQLHGGYGYMEEYAIARLWADCRVQRIYGGANEIMKELIGREFA